MYEHTGLAKLGPARHWLAALLWKASQSGQKVVVFAHHRRVLDGLQQALHEVGLHMWVVMIRRLFASPITYHDFFECLRNTNTYVRNNKDRFYCC